MSSVALAARYDALYNRIATASTVAQMDAALAEWESSPDFQPTPLGPIGNDYRLKQIEQSSAGSWMKTNNRLPASLADAQVIVKDLPRGSAFIDPILEYGFRRELPAYLDKARTLRANRLAELALVTATDTAKATEKLTEVVSDLNDDVASLTDVVAFVSDKVEMSEQERAEVVAVLNDIRANRNAARATVLGVLTELRTIITRAENGILPGATSPSGGRGGIVILAAGAAAAWLAFKG